MKTEPYIKYNPFGTKTGRLTTQKNSFPILTMDKKFRKILKPQNKWFVEFDYNAAEIRVLLGLLGVDQPHIDIHDYNAYELFDGKLTREESKKRIFRGFITQTLKIRNYLSSTTESALKRCFGTASM